MMADRAEDAIDDRVEHPRVGQDSEEENRKDGHRGHGRDILNALDDECAGLHPETADEGGDDRDRDQGDEGRGPFADERRQQRDDCQGA